MSFQECLLQIKISPWGGGGGGYWMTVPEDKEFSLSPTPAHPLLSETPSSA